MFKSSVFVCLVIVSILGLGCAQKAPMEVRAEMAAAPSIEEMVAAPRALEVNHFSRDHAGSISEEDLMKVLNAPVFLQEKSRVGVVQVADRYEMDQTDPTQQTTAVLTKALQDSGLFEAATEITTDWPTDSGISGLRELAARYRTEYLLLYRVRHLDRKYANGWGWLYPTMVGAFFAPATTLESFGIIEATMFDVKSGTLLFTTFSRFEGKEKTNLWHRDIKWDRLKKKLINKNAEQLSQKVIDSCRILETARADYYDAIEKESNTALAAGPETDEKPLQVAAQ